MKPSEDRNWTVVLAGGHGSRLSSLTRGPSGEIIPKQFWAPDGRKSLLDRTLARVARMSPPERTLVVVLAEHERFWQHQLANIPPENVVVQPSDLGTGCALLLATMVICARTPDAVITLVPSDHHVENETPLVEAIASARNAATRSNDIILLGIQPDRDDPDYGFIVPDGRGGLRAVRCFVEKPGASEARVLRREGALWSSFILVASATGLLMATYRAEPRAVDVLARALRQGTRQALCCAFARLPPRDFSHHVLSAVPEQLRVLPVPSSGWTDLGTVPRLHAAMPHLGAPATVATAPTC